MTFSADSTIALRCIKLGAVDLDCDPYLEKVIRFAAHAWRSKRVQSPIWDLTSHWSLMPAARCLQNPRAGVCVSLIVDGQAC